MAAGAAGLTEVLTAAEIGRLDLLGDRLRDRLNAFADAHDLPFLVTGYGSMLGFHFSRGPARRAPDIPATPELRALLHLHLLEHGYSYARRGFAALSLPLEEADVDGFAAVTEAFLEANADLVRYAGALAGSCPTTTSARTWRRATTRRSVAGATRTPWAGPWTSSPRSPGVQAAQHWSSASARAGSRCRSPRAGVRVHGIDLSQAMVARLHAKPGGDAIGVTIGDFATARVGRTFALAYLVFNTIMNLTTQDAQVACFQNVAAHLAAGRMLRGRGGFAAAAAAARRSRRSIPSTSRGPRGSGFDEYDLVDAGADLAPLRRARRRRSRRGRSPFRYVWPSELDLMARLVGLRRRERWSGWQREPFTGESETLIAVWEKPG